MKHRSAALAAFFLFAAAQASAQISGRLPLAKSGLSERVQAKINSTVHKLEGPEMHCTVTPITSDGYLLTAMHCVRDCLLENGAAEESMIASVNLRDLLVSNRATNVDVECKKLSVPGLGAKSVRVVATGDGISVFDKQFLNDYPELYSELKGSGYSSFGNDFAVLKIAPAKPLSCLPFIPTNSPPESSIMVVGYPSTFDKKIKSTLHVSPGVIYSDVRQSLAYKAAEDELQRSYLTTIFSDSQIYFTSAQTQLGQSGGPAITARGQIVGVASGYQDTPNAEGKEIHEAIIVSSEMIAKRLPKSVLERSAKCAE